MRKWKTSLKEAPGFYSNLGQRTDKIKRRNVTPHYIMWCIETREKTKGL